jgi:hypothetical protein
MNGVEMWTVFNYVCEHGEEFWGFREASNFLTRKDVCHAAR